MPHPSAKIARDITYAGSAESRAGRAMIRMLENSTGRLRLIRRAEGYEHEVAQGGDFWQIMLDRYGLSLDIVGGSLDNIPRDGPLIVIANHPYGILDGLMMGWLLSHLRGDFRILANRVFRRAADLDRVILPVAFDGTKEAVALNIDTRKQALEFLGRGGAIGVFPGGTVSTANAPFGPPMDPGWRSFTAKMIARSDATVVPIFFDGHNSRLFQIASHMHQTLRLGLLIKEFRARIDAPVRLVVGEPLDPNDLRALRHEPKQMMDFLRNATYSLSPKPLADMGYGYEFEARYKKAGR